MPQLKFGFQSVVGNFRENNEDAYFVDPAGRFFVVADGMGGQCAGEKASELATQIVPKRLGQLINFQSDAADVVRKSIDRAVIEANSEILALSELDPNFHNMGTTIALLVAVSDRLFIGGVGDSRVYLLRGSDLKQITTDHSLTQALLDAGTITAEDAVTHRYRNVLYRYLGSKEGGTGVDTKEVELKAGDRYVICSDGVTDGLKNPEIRELLSQIAEPQRAAEAIVQASLDGGSRDNVTCVVVHVV